MGKLKLHGNSRAIREWTEKVEREHLTELGASEGKIADYMRRSHMPSALARRMNANPDGLDDAQVAEAVAELHSHIEETYPLLSDD